MLLHEIFLSLPAEYDDCIALYDKYNKFTCTYKQLAVYVKAFSMGLRSLGLKKGEHVAQFSENSPRWFIADQGLISCGAVNAIRGSQAPVAELEYIYKHSDSVGLITDSKKILEYWCVNQDSLMPQFVIYIGCENIAISDYNFQCQFLRFDDVLAFLEG